MKENPKLADPDVVLVPHGVNVLRRPGDILVQAPGPDPAAPPPAAMTQTDKHPVQPTSARTNARPAAPRPARAEPSRLEATGIYRPTSFQPATRARPNAELTKLAHRHGGLIAEPTAGGLLTKPNTTMHRVNAAARPEAKRTLLGTTRSKTVGAGLEHHQAPRAGEKHGAQKHRVQPNTQRELAVSHSDDAKRRPPKFFAHLAKEIETAISRVTLPRRAGRLPQWMLEGGAPPSSLVRSKKLPKSLTTAGNPRWRTPAGRERFAFDYLRRALHIGPNAAAALVGNMAVESRYHSAKGHIDLVPGRWQTGTARSAHVLATGEAGFGIAMWTNATRQQALKTFAGRHADNFALELAFVAHELTSPQQIVGGKHVNLIPVDTLERLRNAASIQEATAIVMAVYESPTSYQEVPKHFTSVNDLLGEFHAGAQAIPTGPNPVDASGYFARLAAAKKMKGFYGKG